MLRALRLVQEHHHTSAICHPLAPKIVNCGFDVPTNLLMVASPSALMPSRTTTFLTVKKIILISSQNERLSTYHTSSLNLSSQLMALRPLICAQPVIPGRT